MTTKKFPAVMVLVVILFGILAACKNEETPVPQAQPSTAIPTPAGQQQPDVIPTRIVTLTPRPTIAATARPTPNFDVTGYEGAWTMLLRYDLTGHAAAEEIIYSMSAGVNIFVDGTVFGSGNFTS
ncbi:MAG TPA: hypothetical protein VJZ27_11600, partial [Aggregatilineales bacterium]|nr:hypothetical protein [Aggregatilineales bacterium]